MNGLLVKQILKKNGYSLISVADAMGESPQGLQSLLRASDIKTGVLERIAAAINKNVYFFFDEVSLSGQSDPVRSPEIEVGMLRQFIQEKDERIKDLKDILEQQKEVIKLLQNDNARLRGSK